MNKKCPQCGQLYGEEYSFCQDDGADLVAVETPAPPSASPSALPRVSPAAPPVIAPAPDEATRGLSGKAPLSPVALITGLALLLGAGMFVAGVQNQQRAAEERRRAEEDRIAAQQGVSQNTTPEANGKTEVVPEETPPGESVAIPSLVGTWEGTWPWINQSVKAMLVVTNQNGDSFDGVLTLFFQKGRSQVRVRGTVASDKTVQLAETQLIAQAHEWGMLSTSTGRFSSDWRRLSGQFTPTKIWQFRWVGTRTAVPAAY